MDIRPLFAHVSQGGTIRYGDVPSSIGVLESLESFMPIGEAHCLTWVPNGLAVWSLKVRGRAIAGRWVIIDRQFKPAQGNGRVPRRLARPDSTQFRGWRGPIAGAGRACHSGDGA
jgi:hypothetical protein